ncbi:MAG: hypothetical protein KDB80_17715, partial [Planctomycetes bacterium]|nr:hypothetical protein [Planctomycetota bacterium]
MTLLAPSILGQGCSQPGQTFFKNDVLPDVPSGSTPVALIGGLCEGEACGAVIDVGGPGQVDSVAVMLAQAAGVNGSISVVDVEIYDGVSISGNQYTLGPRVFSLSNDLGANLQLTSHGINTYDLPTPVATTQSQIAIVFPMLLNNLNGNCQGGYTTNFATDNAPCNTHGRNILKTIAAPGNPPPGYYDPQQLTILGFPLCPLFYTGNWIIRACVTPDVQMTWQGNPSPGNFVLLDFLDPGNPGLPYIVMMSSSANIGFDFSTVWPNTLPMGLDVNVFWNCFMGPCRAMFVNGGSGVLDANGHASDVLQIPTGTFWSGVTLYGAFFTWDPSDFFTWHS